MASKCSCIAFALRAMRKFIPRSDLPGAQQATPLGLNRYIILFMYMFQTFMTGCVYFGWAPFLKMLLRAGVFSFKCETDQNGLYIDDHRLKGHNYICDEQDTSAQTLYVITLAVHCSMSALAGTMMDTLGPKLTSMIGQCFHISGWCLISTFTPQSNATVYAAFVLIGLGADTAFLPTLLASRLFPGSAATVITVIGSASSASFAIPLILDKYLTNDGISGCWWYVGFGPGAFLIIDFLLMPMKAFKVFEGDKPSNLQDVVADKAHLEGSFKTLQLTQQETAEFSVSPPMTTFNNNGQGDSVAAVPLGSPRYSFFRALFSERYLLIVMYFTGVSWATSFYQEAHERVLVPSAQDLLGTILPLSFIPCILLGKLVEFIGVLPVIAVVNTAGALAYAFSMKQVEATGYLSVLCFMVYMSLFVSQIFLYIEDTFSANHFGRLIGFVQLVGGLLSLLCSPLFRLTVGLGPSGMYVVQLPMIFLLVLMYAVVARLWWLWRKNPSPFAEAISDKKPLQQQSINISVVTPGAGGGLLSQEP